MVPTDRVPLTFDDDDQMIIDQPAWYLIEGSSFYCNNTRIISVHCVGGFCGQVIIGIGSQPAKHPKRQIFSSFLSHDTDGFDSEDFLSLHSSVSARVVDR